MVTPLRRTIHCLVFGPRGSGKSSLVRSLAGAPQRSLPAAHSPLTGGGPPRGGGSQEDTNQAAAAVAIKCSLTSVGAVQGDDGRERVVVLTEVPEVGEACPARLQSPAPPPPS